MANHSPAQASASLRALTYRISSTSSDQLPHVAPQLAAMLWNCRPLLASPGDAFKARSDASQIANRFRSTISQLLQARSVEERWAAVVLTKAALEAGGIEAVTKAAAWTKGLIAILKKKDPPPTTALAVITLTRIFMLTWEDANLVREITTPSLPGFVQPCLSIVEKRSAPAQLLQVVLEAFATLLPRHPTIFRTYEGQIRLVLLRILSSTPSSSETTVSYTATHHEAARTLLVRLHYCAPKQGGAEKWAETLKATATAAHATCDRLLRSLNESWKSIAGITRSVNDFAGEPHLKGTDACGLSSWQGVHAGAERLITLVDLLRAHFENSTASASSMRIGLVIDLINRLLSVDTDFREQTAYFNDQTSKDERELLFSALPGIHIAALELLNTVVQRLGGMVFATLPCMLDMLSAVFAAESSDSHLREAAYRLLYTIIGYVGPSLSRDSVSDLSLFIRLCCDDLLPVAVRSTPSSAGAQNGYPATNGIPATNHCEKSIALPALRTAAFALLPLLFTKLDQSLLPNRLRTKMEQTAVLTKHKDALIACVLNPPRKTRGTALRPSLLPLLAREFPECAEVEALLRPRMPVVGGGVSDGGELNCDVEEEDESEMEDGGKEEESDVNETEEAQDASYDGMGGLQIPALQPNAAHVERVAAGEVFSTAPERVDDLDEAYPSKKRAAVDVESSDDTKAKRVRASPVASSSAADSDPSKLDASFTTLRESATGVNTATVPAPSMASQITGGEVDSNDSDFEIPPLTMESDSEGDEGADE